MNLFPRLMGSDGASAPSPPAPAFDELLAVVTPGLYRITLADGRPTCELVRPRRRGPRAPIHVRHRFKLPANGMIAEVDVVVCRAKRFAAYLQSIGSDPAAWARYRLGPLVIAGRLELAGAGDPPRPLKPTRDVPPRLRGAARALGAALTRAVAAEARYDAAAARSDEAEADRVFWRSVKRAEAEVGAAERAFLKELGAAGLLAVIVDGQLYSSQGFGPGFDDLEYARPMACLVYPVASVGGM